MLEQERIEKEGYYLGEEMEEIKEPDEPPYYPPGAPNPAVHAKTKKKKKLKKSKSKSVVDNKEHYPQRPGKAVRDLNGILSRIKKSPKPKQLAAWVLSAKGLYKKLSVVDRPIDKKIESEIAYAAYIAERLAVIQEEAFYVVTALKDHKLELLDQLSSIHNTIVYCRHCKYETKRHLDFCPTCGRQQSYFLDTVSRNESMQLKTSDTKSIENNEISLVMDNVVDVSGMEKVEDGVDSN